MKKLYLILLIAFTISSYAAQDTSNTINRNHFNFGHQLGFIYSRMDDAYFQDPGSWNFQTGFVAFYTSDMPLVRNPDFKRRLMLTIPLYFEVYPCNSIALQAEVTDLFVEFPYKSMDNIGGKSPRFKTKIRLLKEKSFVPAVALTIGVKFSSAKPYTIWKNDHNYDESNGLAGAGTGVADYLILFTFSKTVDSTWTINSRLGLAPLGSPVEYRRGSAQADEIPYGIAVKKKINDHLTLDGEISGMYNGLPYTILAHYSVARIQVLYKSGSNTFTFNCEHGLTRESDEWVVGFLNKIEFHKK